ncbi:hypothetical protein [Kerstersia similis]|uniref:hypothetical protein n=1 Tax=Kerstersia similis TaxID=206505 RepID=UPI0039EEBA6A
MATNAQAGKMCKGYRRKIAILLRKNDRSGPVATGLSQHLGSGLSLSVLFLVIVGFVRHDAAGFAGRHRAAAAWRQA